MEEANGQPKTVYAGHTYAEVELCLCRIHADRVYKNWALRTEPAECESMFECDVLSCSGEVVAAFVYRTHVRFRRRGSKPACEEYVSETPDMLEPVLTRIRRFVQPTKLYIR
jgi:hypothetical protein